MDDTETLPRRRNTANEKVDDFFSRAVAHVERKFWIGRTLERLMHLGLEDEQGCNIPRALRQSPHLAVVAHYWDYETEARCFPPDKVVAGWYARFSDHALGNNWRVEPTRYACSEEDFGEPTP